MKILIAMLKLLCPPILISIYRKIRYKSKSKEMWSGTYKTWQEAQQNCTGYNDVIILKKCKNSLLKVKNGEFAYERDSVLFDEIQYSWPVLATLQRAAIENNNHLCVIDFGGSLGSSYYQNRQFLSSLKKIDWCIVEQSHFVECGRSNFENNELKFYNSVDQCFTENKPTVMLLSGVLQYLEKPFDWIEYFSSLNIDYLIIDRVSLTSKNENIISMQQVPESIYKASYPCWFFSEKTLLDPLMKKYSILSAFDSYADQTIVINKYDVAYWKGFILKRNNYA